MARKALLALCFLLSLSLGLSPGAKESFTNSIGMRFVLIPKGSFMMGSPATEPGREPGERLHRVSITRPFYLQTTEVTRGQYQRLMGAKAPLDGLSDYPADRISFKRAREFIARLNRMEKTGSYRLPTEAEWEYACRAGTTTPFYTGRCLTTDQANYNGNLPFGGCPGGILRENTTNAGSFTPNPFGLYDMHGNVWEWCSDFFGPYPKVPAVDPKGPSGGRHRVLRGGSFGFSAASARSASRLEAIPEILALLDARGFRVARDFRP